MADLIVIGYDDEETAGRAAEAVARLADDLIIQPEAVAVIVRKKDAFAPWADGCCARSRVAVGAHGLVGAGAARYGDGEGPGATSMSVARFHTPARRSRMRR